MQYFVQQLINGLTLGSIYGLIAIGYTMVYGIIGMINFAHGDIFMVGAFAALIVFLILTSLFYSVPVVIALLVMMIVAMLLTSLYNWTIEKVAYRPLRGSFRLAPLITAIGMSIALSNFVQVTQGPRNKPIPPMVSQVYNIDGVSVSLKQIIIVIVTALLLALFWYLVNKTSLGRAQRACEQDRKMAALLGIDVDRTISITFIMGAALAAVAGTLFLMYYGVVAFSDGFTPGVKAFTAAVLGGIGNLKGAVAGGLIIGIIQQLSDNRIETKWTPAIVFAYLILILVFRPQGLFGEKGREAG
jgi:branched-chain amino acid transport system permease protein